jgi:hypothetical protein
MRRLVLLVAAAAAIGGAVRAIVPDARRYLKLRRM